MLNKGSIASLVFLLAAAAPGAAEAGCYEVQGCTDKDIFSESFLVENATCDILWQIRNGIFKERGLCFRTPRAIAAFGNEGCLYHDPAYLVLNAVERTNIATLRRVEQIKGCPR